MDEKTTQEQRLDYLVEQFKADSDEYKDLQVPDDTNGKKAYTTFTDEYPYAAADGRSSSACSG